MLWLWYDRRKRRRMADIAVYSVAPVAIRDVIVDGVAATMDTVASGITTAASAVTAMLVYNIPLWCTCVVAVAAFVAGVLYCHWRWLRLLLGTARKLKLQ